MKEFFEGKKKKQNQRKAKPKQAQEMFQKILG